MMNQLKTSAREFFYTGWGCEFDQFLTEAKRITNEETIHWPDYRRILIAQFALKTIFALGLCLATAFVVALLSCLRYRKLSTRNQTLATAAIIFSPTLGRVVVYFWRKVHDYIKDKGYSSFYNMFNSLNSGATNSKTTLWNCLEKYGDRIKYLDLAYSTEKETDLLLTDKKVEDLIEIVPNLLGLKLNANQLAIDSFCKITQKIGHLHSLEIEGSLNIFNLHYEFLTHLKKLKDLKIDHAVNLTTDGFTFICAVANQLDSLYLGSDALNSQFLQQFCTNSGSPTDIGFYSSQLEPNDFKLLFSTFYWALGSVSFKCPSDKKKDVPLLVQWINQNFHKANGIYFYNFKEDICKIYFHIQE